MFYINYPALRAPLQNLKGIEAAPITSVWENRIGFLYCN